MDQGNAPSMLMEPSEAVEPALTESELGNVLQVPLRVLARMRRKGEGPGWVTCGAYIRYPASSVRKFLASASSAAKE